MLELKEKERKFDYSSKALIPSMRKTKNDEPKDNKLKEEVESNYSQENDNHPLSFNLCDKNDNQSLGEMKIDLKEKEVLEENKQEELYRPPITFFQNLVKTKTKERIVRFMKPLRALSVNFPFNKTLSQFP
jgi:hypothetical protein